jgi:hypothetical protein
MKRHQTAVLISWRFSPVRRHSRGLCNCVMAGQNAQSARPAQGWPQPSVAEPRRIVGHDHHCGKYFLFNAQPTVNWGSTTLAT